jgi:ATP/maltotriose-dependent transcriptional regulator MalT
VGEILVAKDTVSSWAERIAAAAARQEARGMAALVKPAALAAAVAGRLDLIEGWLQHLPSELVESDPQLLYWSGATLLMKRPADAQLHLTRAFELFQRQGKGNWTLLA